MLYRIRKVSLPYLLQPSLEPVPSALEGSKQDVQIQCNTGTYSQTVFPSAIRLWNTLPMDICQLPADSFKTHLHSFLFNSSPDFVLFLSICTVLFLSEVTGCCLLYDFLGAHLLTHSQCDIARIRVIIVTGKGAVRTIFAWRQLSSVNHLLQIARKVLNCQWTYHWQQDLLSFSTTCHNYV